MKTKYVLLLCTHQEHQKTHQDIKKTHQDIKKCIKKHQNFVFFFNPVIDGKKAIVPEYSHENHYKKASKHQKNASRHQENTSRHQS